MGAVQSKKIKFSAVLATIATVFASLVGAVPAHATGYASNANSVVGVATPFVATDGLNKVALPSGLSSGRFFLTAEIRGSAATNAIGQSISQTWTVLDPSGMSAMGGGSAGWVTFYDSSNFSLSSGNAPITVPANTARITITATYNIYPSIGTLTAGQWTAAPTVTIGGNPVTAGANVSLATYGIYGIYGQSITSPSGADVGANGQSGVQLMTCLSPSVTAGTTVVPRVLVNGVDESSSTGSGLSLWNPNNGSDYWAGNYTVTAGMLANGQVAIYGRVQLASGTNSYDLSVLDGSNNEVSTACSSGTAPSAPTGVTPSANGSVAATVSASTYSNKYVCNAYLAASPYTLAGSSVTSSSNCTVTGLTAGTSYTLKLSMAKGIVVNQAPYLYANPVESVATASFTIPMPGITLTAPSGSTSAGSARVLSTVTNAPTGATFTSSASDGSDGVLYAAAVPSATAGGTNYSLSVGHLTPNGADSTFAGSGSASLASPIFFPNTITMSGTYNVAPTVGWYGARDKWATSYQVEVGSASADYKLATGTFASGTVSELSVTGATLSAFCASTFSTGSTVSSLRPVSMSSSVPVWQLSCFKQVTLADNSSRSANAAAFVTIPNAATINAIVTMGGTTSSVNAYSARYSANPAAGSTDAALTAVLTTAGYTSGVSASVISRSLVRITPSLAVTTSSTAYSTATAYSSNELTLAINNSGTVYGIVGTASARIATIGATGDVVLGQAVTFDSAGTTNFSMLSSSYPSFSGAAQTGANGNLFFTRTATTSTSKSAVFKVDLATGAATTSEVVSYSSSAGMFTPTFMSSMALTSSGDVNWYLMLSSNQSQYSQLRWNSLYVPSGPSSDATAAISVNDGSAHSVTNGGTLNVSNSVTSVTVTVTPNEAHATVGAITGGSNLQIGNNTVSFTVTAQDGSTQNYSFTVARAASAPSNIATALMSVNGSTTGNNATVNLANGTTSVTVVVTPTESHATYVVSGNTGLTTGNNTVTVTVTAQDGTTTQVYSFTAAVAASNVATATFTVNGTAVTDGGSISVANGTTSATVVVTRTESHATVGTISGASNLSVGDNTVSFTVTAQDGTTTRTYSFNVVRLPSDAVACVAGKYSTHGGNSSVTLSWSCVDAPAGSYVSTTGATAATPCPIGYFSAAAASTSCTPASVGHYVGTSGATAEVACPANTHALNTGSAACDPDRVLSSNKNVAITVGGKPVTAGGVIKLIGLPGRLDVNAAVAEVGARAYLSIPVNPVLGDNVVSIIVQAEDGSRSEQQLVVRIEAPVVTPPVVTPPVVTPPVVTPPVVTPPVVTPPVVTPPAKSKDATAAITVAGISVNDGDHVNLPFGTTTVAVAVTPTESHATYTVAGNTALATGTSVLTVTVTAEDGTTKAYSYQLVVAADKSPVNLGTSSASTLQQVQAALDAGRVASFTVTAKGAAAASKVLAQIRAFKAGLRAAGSAAKVSFAISGSGATASAIVKVTP